MKKTALAVAMLLSMGSTAAQALSIDVTTMKFYDANGAEGFYGGGLNTSVVGTVNSSNTGVFNSGTVPFFGTPWTATQVMYDDTHGVASNWSGSNTQGPWSYDYILTGNQVATGVLFDWGAATGIAVLAVFDCGPNAGDPCTSVYTEGLAPQGTIMQNGPFAGQHATFEGIANDVFDADPIANNNNIGALIDAINTLDVLINDTDYEDGSPPPAPPAVVTTVGGISAQSFTIAANADGTVTYTTTGGYTGGDSFQYTLTDSFGNVSAAATVNITVAPPNQAPNETSPALTTSEDTPLAIDVSTIASDGNGDPLTYSFFDIVATGLGGAITVNGANTILTYTPPANVSGSDAFTYTANDGIADSGVGTITVTVTPVNDDPVCTDSSLNTDTNAVLAIDVPADLIANCTDIEGDSMTAVIASQPVQAGSTVATDGAGAIFTYTPATDFTGKDSFTYTVSDGNGGTTAAVTANIKVGGDLLSNFTMLAGDGTIMGGTNDVDIVWDEVTFNNEQAVTDVDATGPLAGYGIPTDKVGVMTIASPTAFFGFNWKANNVRVFKGPAKLKFDVTCEASDYAAGTVLCNKPLADQRASAQFTTMELAAGQIGAHMTFDWGKDNPASPCGLQNCNIDVINVWAENAQWSDPDGDGPTNNLWLGPEGVPPAKDTDWRLVSTDAENNGVNGIPMIDGYFIGSNANFNFKPAAGGAGAELYTGGLATGEVKAPAFSIGFWSLLTGLLSLIGLRRFKNKK